MKEFLLILPKQIVCRDFLKKTATFYTTNKESCFYDWRIEHIVICLKFRIFSLFSQWLKFLKFNIFL